MKKHSIKIVTDQFAQCDQCKKWIRLWPADETGSRTIPLCQHVNGGNKYLCDECWDEFDSFGDYPLQGKPHTEVSKLKIFMDTFNSVRGNRVDEVREDQLVAELIHTDKFSKEEAELYIKKAMQNGQIYERRSGFYNTP